MAHRDGRIYLIGQCLSVVGDGALWLGMAIWVKMLTQSNSAAALTFFAFICGSLFAPVGGLIADRFRRRPLLIWANFGSAVLVCLLLLVTGRHELWLIYLVMFGYGAVGSTILSAQTALLAEILPDDLLVEANSVLQMAEQGLRVITPVVGAGLLALVGPQPVILVDAATFLAAGLCLLALRTRETKPVHEGGRWRAEFTAGIRHIGSTAALRRLLVAGVVALVAFGVFLTLPFAIVDQGLHRSPTFVGVLQVAMGVGALAGGLVVGMVMNRTSERTVVLLGIVASAVGSLLLATGQLVFVLIGMGLIGGCNLWINVGGYVIIQRRTPSRLIGRVDAALSMAIMIPQALALGVGSGLLAVVNLKILLIGVAVVFALSTLPLLRRVEEAPNEDAAKEAEPVEPTEPVEQVAAAVPEQH
jgi:MFS family permease